MPQPEPRAWERSLAACSCPAREQRNGLPSNLIANNAVCCKAAASRLLTIGKKEVRIWHWPSNVPTMRSTSRCVRVWRNPVRVGGYVVSAPRTIETAPSGQRLPACAVPGAPLTHLTCRDWQALVTISRATLKRASVKHRIAPDGGYAVSAFVTTGRRRVAR